VRYQPQSLTCNTPLSHADDDDDDDDDDARARRYGTTTPSRVHSIDDHARAPQRRTLSSMDAHNQMVVQMRFRIPANDDDSLDARRLADASDDMDDESSRDGFGLTAATVTTCARCEARESELPST
jgi:hypothetical protein